jgi:hypothetical protein
MLGLHTSSEIVCLFFFLLFIVITLSRHRCGSQHFICILFFPFLFLPLVLVVFLLVLSI